ncbi:MAG: hydrogenase maturation protease [Coriobacteriales bacterium]|jgi:hydrogenase maturation protease|nr:hydrogenase maturation protease [Coriobacteriales bacterium]
MGCSGPERVVLCVGNLLMGDEGLGPTLAQAMASEQVLDAGTVGYAMLSEFRRYQELLLVDAIDGSGKPAGTLLRFKPGQLRLSSGFRGAHDIGLSDVIMAAHLLGLDPKIECCGIQIARMDFGLGLSQAVKAALPALQAYVEAWLAR